MADWPSWFGVRFVTGYLFFATLFFSGCGGDGEETAGEDDKKKETETSSAKKPPPVEESLPEPEAPKVIPDPNGVYVDTGDLKNEKPVFAGGDGFYLWYDSAEWKISDKVGGGKVVSEGKGGLNERWSNRGKVRHFPDKDFAKDGLFRLAVACQGSEDHATAIRLFNQFIREYPDDPQVADAHLSLGDLVIAAVKPTEKPTFRQITKARMHYAKVRELAPDNPQLFHDSTFNDGNLLETVAKEPEGHVNFYVGDKDELSSSEYQAAGERAVAAARMESNGTASYRPVPLPEFSKADANSDKVVDYGEFFDAVTLALYQGMEGVFRGYIEKLGEGGDPAAISQATHKIGFACEKQGRPAEMLRIYLGDITKYGNNPGSVGVDDMLKVYVQKYEHYDKLYGKTLTVLENVTENLDQDAAFTYKDPLKGNVEIKGKVRDHLNNTRNLTWWLNTEFVGMDGNLKTQVVRNARAVQNNNKVKDQFEGYVKKYREFRAGLPAAELAPSVAFRTKLNEAQSGGKRTLELRMRAILKEEYSPDRDDFVHASPFVLVFIAEKFLERGRQDEARAAMERLLDVFGEVGGEFLFDAHFLLGKAALPNHGKASAHFEQALINSSWHEKAPEASLLLGDSLFQLGSVDKAAYERAFSVFEGVRDDTDLTIAQRAQASYMMGQCQSSLRNRDMAAYYYRNTTRNFRAGGDVVDQAFRKALSHTDDPEQNEQIDQAYQKWKADYNR